MNWRFNVLLKKKSKNKTRTTNILLTGHLTTPNETLHNFRTEKFLQLLLSSGCSKLRNSSSFLLVQLVQQMSGLVKKATIFSTKRQYSKILQFTNLNFCWQLRNNVFFSVSFLALEIRIDNLTIQRVTWFCLETLRYLYSYPKQNHEHLLNRIVKTLYTALRTILFFSYCQFRAQMNLRFGSKWLI